MLKCDVMSAETIENPAYDYLPKSRKFNDRYNWRAVDAAIVESWIQRVDTVLLREVIKAISWVVGVKVLQTTSGRRFCPENISLPA